MRHGTIRIAGIAATLAFTAAAGWAQSFEQSVVDQLQASGYEFIEIQKGQTQLKAEAIQGTSKLEVIWDMTTGQILKKEMEAAEDDEIGLSGVVIRERDRDFVRTAGIPTGGTSAIPTDSTGNASADAIIGQFTSGDYQFVEAKLGPTQLKIEAIRGGLKEEYVFDVESGDLLKKEIEAAEADETGLMGFEFDMRDEDFIDDHDDDDDHGGHGSSDDDEDDDDHEDNSGPGNSDDDSDDGDEDDNSGHGSDDD